MATSPTEIENMRKLWDDKDRFFQEHLTATYDGDLRAVKDNLESGRCGIDDVNRLGVTALMAASRCHHTHIVSYLLSYRGIYTYYTTTATRFNTCLVIFSLFYSFL